jgi:hypothetical protein
MRLPRTVLDTLDTHYLKRVSVSNHPVMWQARDFYVRLGYANAIYFTFNMQYWCAQDAENSKFWPAVRAEIKLIHSYRPDNS